MNPPEIASAVIAFLSPYLIKTGEEVAAKAGEAVWKKVEEIHKAIKVRFAREKDDYSRNILRGFEEKPEKRKEALREVLTEIIQKDQAFAARLSKLLEEAKGKAILAGPEFVTNVFGGEIGEIINIGSLNELIVNKGSRKK
jgi:hypothetical protein